MKFQSCLFLLMLVFIPITPISASNEITIGAAIFDDSSLLLKLTGVVSVDTPVKLSSVSIEGIILTFYRDNSIGGTLLAGDKNFQYTFKYSGNITSGKSYDVIFTYTTSCGDFLSINTSLTAVKGSVGVTTFTTNGDPKLPDCNDVTPSPSTTPENSSKSNSSENNNVDFFMISAFLTLPLFVIGKKKGKNVKTD